MNTRPSWDESFISLCHVIAKRSKDESTKLSSVIVGPDHEIRSTGYNCFPRGVNDNIVERQERPLKYSWFEHAERNAIYNAARMGTPLRGCTIYVPWIPCPDCARAIIQSGIVEIVVETMIVPERWRDAALISMQMLREAGIILREMRHG